MVRRTCAILFLVLAVTATVVKLSVTAPGRLVDAALIVSLAGFVICVIGALGRRLADLTRGGRGDDDDRHRSSPPRLS